ncbi:arginine--tRNA ligase [Aliikangiella maris]|uniref:Arginine--tRNA ligase n=2 Tax=Aliikangiella maris TaxID=3162458 RepID=A0ABV2BTH1_9GAMM
MKAVVEAWLIEVIAKLKEQAIIPESVNLTPQVTHTKDKSHGDYATNAALMLAKPAKKSPLELAELISSLIGARGEIEKLEIAGPGFINFFLSQDASMEVINSILQQQARYGTNNDGQGKPVQVEFVSANPTGPLHFGHGRGAVVGDCLARVLTANGWKVTKEFYYNDAGQQINNLALSVQARCKNVSPDSEQWHKDWYKGDYIKDVAADYLAKQTVDAADKHVAAKGDADDLQAIREFAVAYLRREQDLDLKAFDVNFDVFFLESSLYENGDIDKTVTNLIESGHTYEKDDALWLRTTDYGDDKDRVMRKSDGGYTYFLPDVAYHVNKWKRGFGRVINEFGADHHSTVQRVKAGLQALDIGIPKDWPEIVLHQMVTVMRGNVEVKISKRAGSYLTLRDIIDEVGRDATRYFLVARRAESQMTFDLELAASQTNDNPVYYIQYAHARICSVFRKLEEAGLQFDQQNGLEHLTQLTSDYEKALTDRLSKYPELVKFAARSLEAHTIAHYLRELANDFHSYYNAGKFIVDDAAERDARLCLISAVKQVLVNGLTLLGVSAPEKM